MTALIKNAPRTRAGEGKRFRDPVAAGVWVSKGSPYRGGPDPARHAPPPSEQGGQFLHQSIRDAAAVSFYRGNVSELPGERRSGGQPVPRKRGIRLKALQPLGSGLGRAVKSVDHR